MTDDWIPLQRPPTVHVPGLSATLDPGLLATSGPHLDSCSHLLSELHDGAPILMTSSCTHALEAAAVLVGFGPGDEVIVPSFTFPSTANAVLLSGATPRFADIGAETLSLDPAHVEQIITPRTRAVVTVHYAGVPCDLDRLVTVANSNGLSLVEDNAHGAFGRYRGRPLGTFGELAALSFHRTKNLATGEGGALVLNRAEHLSRAEILIEKGTDRRAFERGEVEAYTWREVGSSWAMTELAAAVLEPQLRNATATQARRRFLWDRYQRELGPWASSAGVRLPAIPAEVDHPAHLFWIRLPTQDARQRLVEHLASRRIASAHHYLPLHSSPMGASLGARPEDCPVTNEVARTLLRLPLYSDLTDPEQDRVLDAVLAFSP